MATNPEPARIFFSAGEASGDAYAAALLTRIQEKRPVAAEGIGGRKFAAAGGRLVDDSSSWGAIGIAEAIAVYPRVRVGFTRAIKALKSGKPGLFIPIDFGYMNIRLCRIAKEAGWKVLYFVPPGSWKRGPQGRDLPKLTDAVVTPTSWSHEALISSGTNAFWFGHPLKELRASTGSGEKGDGIAALLGSRGPEVGLLLPVVAEVAKDTRLAGRIFEFPIAPNVNLEAIEREWKRLTGRTEDRFLRESASAVLGRCRAGIVCSGTATLEAALARCPMVIVYKVRKIAEFEAWLLRIKPKYFGLPNLVLDRSAVPELLQAAVTPGAIVERLAPLLENGSERQSQLEAFEEIDAALGSPTAITEAANLAVSMIA